MPVILMTTLFYKALILQGEIWCWSLLGLKGLIMEVSFSSQQADEREQKARDYMRAEVGYTAEV